jgi:hypothetical protein
MHTLRVTAQKTGLLTVKHRDVRLRKIRSLKTSVLTNKPLRATPVTARALETKPPGTMSDQRP